MGEGMPRLVYASYSHKTNNSRLAIFILLCLICPAFQPVTADVGVTSTDFGILDEMADIYELQQAANSNQIAQEQATMKLNLVDSAARGVDVGDAIIDSANYLQNVSTN